MPKFKDKLTTVEYSMGRSAMRVHTSMYRSMPLPPVREAAFLFVVAAVCLMSATAMVASSMGLIPPLDPGQDAFAVAFLAAVLVLAGGWTLLAGLNVIQRTRRVG